VIGLGEIHGDEPAGMTGQYVRLVHQWVGAPILEESEGKPELGILTPVLHRQPELQQREEKTSLRLLHAPPPAMALLPVVVHPDTRDSLIERAGKTIGFAWRCHQPVAEIEFGVIAATVVELTCLCCAPPVRGVATQITHGIERQQIAAHGIEAEAAMAVGTQGIFKK